MDGSFGWVSTTPVWHIDAVGGRPPHQYLTVSRSAGEEIRRGNAATGATFPVALNGVGDSAPVTQLERRLDRRPDHRTGQRAVPQWLQHLYALRQLRPELQPAE